MVLSKEERQALADLEAKERAPEPRTDTGLPGILHALIDSASGAVAHRSGDSWADLHRAAEELAGATKAKPSSASSSSAKTD